MYRVYILALRIESTINLGKPLTIHQTHKFQAIFGDGENPPTFTVRLCIYIYSSLGNPRFLVVKSLVFIRSGTRPPKLPPGCWLARGKCKLLCCWFAISGDTPHRNVRSHKLGIQTKRTPMSFIVEWFKLNCQSAKLTTYSLGKTGNSHSHMQSF